MSVVRPFLEARALLGVPPEADSAAVKRAYRRLTIEHPPDSDPEGFRRIRDAYELLVDPGTRARDLLLRPVPAVDPPALPELGEDARRGATALAVLRAAAARIDAGLLLGAAGERKVGP